MRLKYTLLAPVRHLTRLTAWVTPRALIEETGPNVTHARGVAHAVKRLTFVLARHNVRLDCVHQHRTHHGSWQALTMTRPNCRRWVIGFVLASLLLQLVGCGTIFWPERRGQPSGRLDPKVVALDAVGLLLFFIPGVIAFAVDFNNGTIYLPPDSQASSQPSPLGWDAVRASSKTPDAEEIEQIICKRTGKSVRLQLGRYHAAKLHSLQELADVNLDPISLATACEAKGVRFRCQSE